MARADKYTPISEKKEFFSDFLINFDQNPITGNLAKVTNEESVKQSIRNILLTNKTERPYQPNLGSRINSFLFENFESTIIGSLSTEIKTVLEYNEPRAIVEKVDVKPFEDDNSLQIDLYFSTINNPQITSMSIVLQRVR